MWGMPSTLLRMHVGQGFSPVDCLHVGQGFSPADYLEVGQGFSPADKLMWPR
jgi:hypothetical protein